MVTARGKSRRRQWNPVKVQKRTMKAFHLPCGREIPVSCSGIMLAMAACYLYRLKSRGINMVTTILR